MNIPKSRSTFVGRLPRGSAVMNVVWVCVLVICVGVVAYVAMRGGPEPPPLPPPPSIDTSARAKFFDDQVQREIANTDQANREAAERCIQRLRDMFDQHRKGVAPFTNDLTSMGTRFRILRRMPSDWWNEQNEVQEFISTKFENHLFSGGLTSSGCRGGSKHFSQRRRR